MRTYEKVMDWILVLYVLYMIYLLTQRINTGSIGFEEIVLVALILNLAYSLHINAKVSDEHWLQPTKKRRR